jgi:hypothetical protein
VVADGLAQLSSSSTRPTSGIAFLGFCPTGSISALHGVTIVLVITRATNVLSVGILRGAVLSNPSFCVGGAVMPYMPTATRL